jgi:hypothetical protein
MNGEVPEIYWFLLWVGVLVFVIAFGTVMTVLVSRANTKALALLTLYAEKGIDPPPTLAELLKKPCGEANGRWKTTPSGEERLE